MEKRLCEECKEIEDEVHYLLYCKKYQNECETLMKKLSSSCDLSSLSDKEKLKILLCSSDTVLKAIAVFMSHSLINNFSHVCMYIYIYICICYVMMKPHFKAFSAITVIYMLYMDIIYINRFVLFSVVFSCNLCLVYSMGHPGL